MEYAQDFGRPELNCPECRVAHGRFLPFVSGMALVDYYRCWECGYVWTMPKVNGASTIHVQLKADRRRHPRKFAG